MSSIESRSNLISRDEAAEEFARLTGLPPPHTATVSRWILYGIDGVRLRGRRVGGRRYVCGRTAVVEFLRELNADAEGDR